MSDSGKSAAEIALQKKYELLRKKKEQAAKAAQAPAAGSPLKTPSIARPSTATPAVAAAQTKQQQQQPKETKPSTSGFTIPKRKSTSEPANEPQKQQRETGPPSTSQPHSSQETVPTAKNKAMPELKRPTIRRRPQQGTAGANVPRPTTDSQQVQNYNSQHEEAPAAKKLNTAATNVFASLLPDQPQQQQQSGGGGSTVQQPQQHEPAALPPQQPLPTEPKLMVTNLPGHYNKDKLTDLFLEFGEVVDAELIPGFNCGFVTFSDFNQATALLDFQTHQPLEVEDRLLKLTWATPQNIEAFQGLTTGYTGEEGIDAHGIYPTNVVAKTMAQQVAAQIDDSEMYNEPPPARDLVCYDDL